MRSQGFLLVTFANNDLNNRGGEEAETCEQEVDETGLPQWEVLLFLTSCELGPKRPSVRGRWRLGSLTRGT